MATHVLKDCKLYVAQYDLSALWKSGKLECKVATPDATLFGSNSKNYAVGLKSHTANFTGLFDKTTTYDPDDSLYPLFDAAQAYLLYDVETVAFAVGGIVEGATSHAKATIVSITDWGTEGRLLLRNITGTFQDGETISGVGAPASPGSATVNGTLGETYLAYDNEASGPFTVGNTITGVSSGVTGTLRGLQDDGATGKMIISGATGTYTNDEQIGDGTATADVNVDSITYSRLTNTPDTVITICPATGADGEVAYSFKSAQQAYTPIDGTVGDVAGFNVNATGSGKLMRGKILKNTAVDVTTSGYGTAYNLGAVSATQKIYTAIHVYEIDGGTLEVRIASDDNEGFTSSTVREWFSMTTGVTSQWKERSGPFTDTWWRTSWTYNGTACKFIVVMTTGGRVTGDTRMARTEGETA